MLIIINFSSPIVVFDNATNEDATNERVIEKISEEDFS
jgi:hypothetical protein